MKHFKTFEEHFNEAFVPKNIDNRHSSLVSQVLNVLPIIEEKKFEWIKAFNEYSKYFYKIANLEDSFSKLSDEDKIRCEEIFKMDIKALHDAVSDAPMYPGSYFKEKLQEINGLKKLISGSGMTLIASVEDLIEATKNSKNIIFHYDFEDEYGSIYYPKGRGHKNIPVIAKQHKRGLSLKIEYPEDNLKFLDELLKSLNKHGFTSEMIKHDTILITKYQKL